MFDLFGNSFLFDAVITILAILVVGVIGALLWSQIQDA